MKCKFYSEEIGKCLFDGPPDDCPFENNENNCACFRPIKESKNMKRCKYHLNYESGQYDFDICSYDKCKHNAPILLCTHKGEEDNCTCFEPIEYEKESSPYRLNSTEANVFSKLFKDYIKDENKLEKLVETFRSYLSNASKSPANAEGKCSDEDTLYRIMKERIEDKKEQRIGITLKEIKQDAIIQFVNLVNKKLEYYDKHNIKLSAFYLSSMMKEALHELGYED